MIDSVDPLATPLDARSACLAKNWWVVAIRGGLAILFGLIALFMPGAAIGGLVLLFAAYMLADGVFSIISGVRAARQQERWWPLVLEGVIDLAAGVIALVWPHITVLVFAYLLAAWAVITGVLETSAGARLHRSHGRWWLIAGGIISVVWGVLLFIAPFIGALVITLWLGAYALLFGISLLVLAFRLRARRQIAPPAGLHA